MGISSSGLAAPPTIFSRLSTSKRVLIAGAGGGFDVFAGLPLYFALRAAGATVHLANLSFTNLPATSAKRRVAGLYEVRPDDRGSGDGYFPEHLLAQWLASRGEDPCVFAFDKTGVRPLRAAYAHLVEGLSLDAIVLVDGGTDILMRGDEAGLGTPEEDMASLAAVSSLSIPQKILSCIGFGIDAFHGVCHANFLENVAALARADAFLGAFSVLASMPEGAAFLDAVAFAQQRTPEFPSIVNGSIAAAVEGRFGDVQFTRRTAGSELFINPLMSMYWTFDLDAVASRSLYLSHLHDTEEMFEITLRIEAFRKGFRPRPRVVIPH